MTRYVAVPFCDPHSPCQGTANAGSDPVSETWIHLQQLVGGAGPAQHLGDGRLVEARSLEEARLEQYRQALCQADELATLLAGGRAVRVLVGPEVAGPRDVTGLPMCVRLRDHF